MIHPIRSLATCTLVALAALAGCHPPAARWPHPSPPLLGEAAFNRWAPERYDEYTLTGEVYWLIREGELQGIGRADQGVLIRRGVELEDAFVQARTSRADDGGLVLRFVDEDSYYLLAFRDDQAPAPRGERNLAVYRRVKDAFHEIWTRDVEWTRGQPRTIGFSATGSQLSVYLDGERIGGVRDPYGALPAGRVGVRHYGAGPAWTTRIDAFGWGRAPGAMASALPPLPSAR